MNSTVLPGGEPWTFAVLSIDSEVRVALLVALNFVSYALFRIDKRRAERGGWRIPERTLLLSCMSGGALGGWFAMSFFRHKTIKRSFRVKAVLVTLLSPVWLLVYWWFRGGGEA